MIWALIGLATLATCELFLRLPVLGRVRQVADTAARAGRLVTNSAVSDHWKERVLPRYALRVGMGSLASLVYLVIACSPFVVLVIAGPFLGMDFQSILLSWSGIILVTAGAIAYLFLTKKLRRRRSPTPGTQTQETQGHEANVPRDAAVESDYSSSARIMHRLALASPQRGELLFDIEKGLAPEPPAGAAEGRHIFVTGLARAGTTILMRAIHESGTFASLTYRDMPFVMAPNLWARLSGSSRRETAKAERAHGDGVLVDFDSPEALEEPFWRTFCGSDFIHADALVPHAVDDETIEKYRGFVSHVLARYGAPRYLAKNNNGILRLPATRAAFPSAAIVVPFRAPIDQALSLQNQHARFSAPGDRFTQNYMTWLAHHEFGQDQRPFVFGGVRPEGQPDEIDYWLSMWVRVHRHLLSQATDGGSAMIPISYEDLCQPDGVAWNALCARIGIRSDGADFSARATTAPEPRDAALAAEADAVYARLRMVSHQRLGLNAGPEEAGAEPPGAEAV